MLLRHALASVVVVCVSVAVVSAEKPAKKKRLLLLGQSPDGHPKATHEYLPGMRVIAGLLAKSDLDVTTVNADEPWSKGPEQLKQADGAVIFLSQGAKWLSNDPRRLQAFVRLASRGGGLVALHWGMGTRDAKNIAAFVKLLGGCHGGPDRKYKVVTAAAQPTDHVVATGIKAFTAKEEWYYRLKFPGSAKNFHPVLRVAIDGKTETVSWAWQRPDGGRSFGFSGLHFHENWKRPEYRRLVAQGILWSMKQRIPKEGWPVPLDEKALKLK